MALIPSFEALCLLPDGETFAAARAVPHRGKWRLRRITLDLEAVDSLVQTEPIAILTKRKGYGYAAKFGRLYLKIERKRMLKAGYV